jgi:hypothetical protein
MRIVRPRLDIVVLACATGLASGSGGCGPGAPARGAPTTERERDLVITVVVPEGLALTKPLVVAAAPVLPVDGRGVGATVLVPSPRATQAKGEAALTLAPLRVPRPAWISVHADLDGNGAISPERDALVALAGPVDDDRLTLMIDPFRLDLACVKDGEDTRVDRASVTLLDASTGRLVTDAAVTVETPTGSFALPLPERARPPCPPGTYRARAAEPRLAPFARDRAVAVAYPAGDVMVKVLQTPRQCRESSARVKTAPRSGGAAGTALASVDCPMLDWKVMAGENFALLGLRAPRASLLDVGPATGLVPVRRPAAAPSLAFERAGAYELELYIGRATLGAGGGGYGMVRHVERVE